MNNNSMQRDTQLMVQPMGGNNNGIMFNAMPSLNQQKAAPRFNELSNNQGGLQFNPLSSFKMDHTLTLGDPTPLPPGTLQDDKRKFLSMEGDSFNKQFSMQQFQQQQLQTHQQQQQQQQQLQQPLKKQRREEQNESPPPTTTLELEPEPDEANAPPPIMASKEGMNYFDDNDVLSGRGGGTNVHPGNRNFRDLINLHRRAYLKARKNDKPAISRAIVRAIRKTQGKFLRKDEKSGLWFEIGDDAAREKTSQALRQRAPEMRKLLFDTERDEARAAAEEHLRQQRMLMGSMQSNNGMMGGQQNNGGNMVGGGNMMGGGNNGGMMGQNMNDMNSQSGMMNPALLQAMAANTKNLGVSQGGNDQFSQMFSAALLQGGMNRFTNNTA